ncbi:hypothetical protein F3157_20865 [Virgibacillus dakarensis]|nr:hypothetical protein [Virgibacillus dakarensis]
MVKKIVLLLVVLAFITACSKHEPVVVKKEANADPNENPELVEQNNDDDDTDEFIEFALPEEKVMVNLKMVPILNSYLEASANRAEAIKTMTILPIQAGNANLYLLEFSCSNDLCSYILLDQSKDNPALLVADLARTVQSKLSPDNSKILLQFNREASLPIPLTNLVVVDLVEWEQISLTNETNDLQVLAYHWPIITAEWTDDQTITVSLPDVTEPVNKLLQQWQEAGKPITTIDLQLSTK